MKEKIRMLKEKGKRIMGKEKGSLKKKSKKTYSLPILPLMPRKYPAAERARLRKYEKEILEREGVELRV